MKRPDRAGAASYLDARSSFTAEQILGSLDVMEAAYVEAMVHEHHPCCEHCIRLQLVRDVLVGAPLEGQLL